MKLYLLPKILLAIAVFILISCSSDMSSGGKDTETKSEIVLNYTYNASELETMNLINNYRVSVGLNRLEIINHLSSKSEEHDNYMIINNAISHDGFVARSENIMKTLGAKTVAENVARNYDTPQSVLVAWLESPGHKENIVGNFTHFGIAIKENPETGKKYYTNIFVKI
ncbi:CAP domain-containing protein [Flavobacterium sp. W1B]|uniref:CAP domain-containing protein n=1 Tax=Flavobacterium sp. W1B TaxID=3394146 RepID=UPI0039BC3351